MVLKLWEVSLVCQNFKLRFESQWKSEGIENDLKRRFSFISDHHFVLNFNEEGHATATYILLFINTVGVQEASKT